jgi:electron transport complex protein RnfC
MGIFRNKEKNTFSHGIHPNEHKDTGEKEVRRIPFAPEIILPLSVNIGKASIPCVKKGDSVYRGQKIAEADGYMSVPIHASVSGTVKDIALAPSPDGGMARAIILATSQTSVQSVDYAAFRNIDEMSKAELIKAIQETGMVGLGGAGFPTHVKANPPEGHEVKTILVNGCECEPFLTTDHRVMLESLPDLLLGIKIVMKCTGAEKAIIGLEDNKQDACDAIKSILPKDGNIGVVIMPTKYPQGCEKMLVTSLLNIEIPAGQIPSSIGVGIFNVTTLAQLGKLVPSENGLIERVITVSGPGVARPGNYVVPLGTPLKFILEQCGFSGTAEYVVLGGPMMGKTVPSLDAPITKTASGILAFDKTLSDLKKNEREYPCIKCGACVSVCPMFLNPSKLGLLAKKERYLEMRDEYNLDLCIKCGSCTYICPSNIPLLSLIQTAQEINRTKK